MKTRGWIAIGVFVLFALILAACKPAVAPTPNPPKDLPIYPNAVELTDVPPSFAAIAVDLNEWYENWPGEWGYYEVEASPEDVSAWYKRRMGGTGRWQDGSSLAGLPEDARLSNWHVWQQQRGKETRVVILFAQTSGATPTPAAESESDESGSNETEADRSIYMLVQYEHSEPSSN